MAKDKLKPMLRFSNWGVILVGANYTLIFISYWTKKHAKQDTHMMIIRWINCLFSISLTAMVLITTCVLIFRPGSYIRNPFAGLVNFTGQVTHVPAAVVMFIDFKITKFVFRKIHFIAVVVT